MNAPLLDTILISGGAVLALFFLMWLLHLPLENAAIVDVGWGFGFIFLCLIDIVLGQGFNQRNIFLFTMILLWGLRISFFIFKRIRGETHEDKRYKKMRNEFGKMAWLKFLMIFEFQALLQIMIGVLFVVVTRNASPHLSIVEWLGILIFAAALIGETIADEQLKAFKDNPGNKGKTCDTGLWAYSRHPNYFFEWLIWMGLFIYALASPWGWLAAIGPAIMYYLLRCVSGVPMAEEQSLLSRGDEYRRYQERTSIFFPMPRKSTHA